MIKKILFGLSVCVLGFMGFSSASKIQSVGLDSSPSAYDSSFNLTFLKGGGLLSSFLGQSKSIIALKDNVFFWWATNGQPYYYDQGIVQGFFGQYFLCDPLTGLDSSINNCTEYPITGEYQTIFKSYFDHVVQGDYVFYDYEPASSDSYHDNTIQICFSSENFNKSLCFRQHDCYDGHGCSRYNYGSLINSENLSNLSFGLINYNWIGYAPGQKGYGGEGNIEGGDVVISGDINLTGDMVYTEIGTGDVINYFNTVDGFNSSICYVGTTDLSSPFGTNGISFNEGSGATIFDLYYDKFGVWSGVTNGLQYVANMIDAWTINYYNWFMTDRNPSYLVDFNGQLYTKFFDMGSGLSFPFSNKPVAYYFMADNIWHYSNFYGDSSHLIGNEVVDYCNMLLNGSTIDDMISQGTKSDIIGNYNRNKTTPENLANWKVDGSSWSGVFSSGTIITDGTDFINNFFNKVKGSLIIPNKDGGQNGIVPGYILICMFALILFRLISH